METLVPREPTVPKYFLKKVRNELESVSELAANINLIMGQSNIHAKRLAVLKFEFESIYSAMRASQAAGVEDDENKEDVDITNINIARPRVVKKSARLNTYQLDNINYYIRHLQSEQEIYLLYEYFDLIVAKVKEYGAYDAEQIWNGIKAEVSLLKNQSSEQGMRDILNNIELREGLSLFALNLQEQQERRAG